MPRRTARAPSSSSASPAKPRHRLRSGGRNSPREAIHRLYLANTHRINNWDLVDVSAADIVGAHLDQNRSLLDRLANSASLWERRIAMIATQHYIRRGDFADALRIAAALVGDGHDLIHKASGWMLRERTRIDPKPNWKSVGSRYPIPTPKNALRRSRENRV